MTSRRLELDAAIAEREPLLLVLRGKEYNLPGAIPAKAVLKYLPVINEQGGIPQQHLGDFFSDLIGKETYLDLLEDGLSLPDLNTVVNWVLKEYGLVDKDEDDSENKEGANGRPNS